ncbi:DNA gyrase subunit A [compost metagenome]
MRTRAAEVSQVGRNTQGVTLMRVAGDEKLIAVERLDVIEAEELAAEASPEIAD